MASLLQVRVTELPLTIEPSGVSDADVFFGQSEQGKKNIAIPMISSCQGKLEFNSTHYVPTCELESVLNYFSKTSPWLLSPSVGGGKALGNTEMFNVLRRKMYQAFEVKVENQTCFLNHNPPFHPPLSYQIKVGGKKKKNHHTFLVKDAFSDASVL